METCAAIFLCEGPTDVAVVGACLEKLYGAATEELSTGKSRLYHSKFVISDVRFGMFAPGGLEEAEKALVSIATDRAIRGRYPNLKHLCLIRDSNGHEAVALASRFRNLTADIGNPETPPVEVPNGSFQLPNVILSQMLMGDPAFGASDRNAVDDHVVDCLSQLNRSDLSQLAVAFEDITGMPPTSKQFVNLAMTLDSHLGEPTRYYENVVKNASEGWVEAFIGRIGLEGIVMTMIQESQRC